MKKAKKKLGEILLEAKVVRADQLNMALEQQKRWGGRLASILVEMGSVDEKTIAAVLEEQMGYKCIALHDVQVPPEVLKMVSCEKVQKYHILPLSFEHGRLTIAISDPTDIETIDEISFSLGVDVDPVCASESGIADAIHKFYGKKSSR
jgi:type IV pilus assembly protein PilB